MQAKRQVLPSFAHGLNVIVDPMLYDYAYPINYVQGFDVSKYLPTCVPPGTTIRPPDNLSGTELKTLMNPAI